jgi:WD40 repeat protein
MTAPPAAPSARSRACYRIVSGLALLGLLGAPAAAQEDRARGLAESSAEVVGEDATLGLLLAREALKLADLEPARTALYAALIRARERLILGGHGGAVLHVDLAPDGQAIATASEDGTVRLWTAAGAPLATLKVGAPVLAARFLGSADRVLAATAKELTIWDAAGKKLDAFPVVPHEVRGASVVLFPAPDAVRLVDANGKTLRDMKVKNRGLAAGEFTFWAVTKDGRARWYDERGRERAVSAMPGTAGVAFAASGNLIATYGSAITVELWTPRCRKVGELLHAGSVEHVSVSPEGDRILTASVDGHYAFWTADGKREMRVPKPGLTRHAALAAAGDWAVTLDDGDRVTVWKADGEFASKRFPGIRRVEPNARALGLILDFEDGTRRFAAARLDEIASTGFLRGALTFSRWSNEGNWLLVADEEGRVALQHWYGAGPADLDGHTGAVVHASFSADDRLVLTASRDGTARVWEVDPLGTPVLYHPFAVNGVGFDLDTGRLQTTCHNMIHFRERDGRLLRSITLPGRMIWWGRGADRVAVSCRDQSSAWLYDLEGRDIATLRHDDALNGVEVTLKGDLVVTFSRDTTARLWDGNGKLRATLKHPASVASAAFSDDGALVLTTADDRHGRLWSAEGELQAEFHLPESIWYCVFSPKGDRLVAIPTEQPVARVWTSKGEEVGGLGGHEGRVSSARFSPEGDAIATASVDRTARIWDIDGTMRKVLPHPDEVCAVHFLPERRGIVTACKDGSIRHWDREGQLRAVMHGHVRTVWLMDCTKDGEWLVTGSEDTTARMWPLRREDLLRIAGERASRDFTDEERYRYERLLTK